MTDKEGCKTGIFGTFDLEQNKYSCLLPPEVIEKIRIKGGGIHHLRGNRYAFGESWMDECIPEEYKDDPYAHIQHIEEDIIPGELRDNGYTIICPCHHHFTGDNIPYGWTVALLKKK